MEKPIICTNKANRCPNSYVSPKGEWYNAVFYHPCLAKELCEYYYPDFKSSIAREYDAYLLSQGWRKTMFWDGKQSLYCLDPTDPTQEKEDFHITKAQYEALRDYFDSKPVWRGLTIDQIWFEYNRGD